MSRRNAKAEKKKMASAKALKAAIKEMFGEEKEDYEESEMLEIYEVFVICAASTIATIKGLSIEEFMNTAQRLFEAGLDEEPKTPTNLIGYA